MWPFKEEKDATTLKQWIGEYERVEEEKNICSLYVEQQKYYEDTNWW